MKHDVVIVGAGPAGLCLARALADQALDVALVERLPAQALAEPGYDGREIALTHASVRILKTLGVWEHLPDDTVFPLQGAQVMDRNTAPVLRIDSALVAQEQLGCLVANQQIRRAAWQAVSQAPGIAVYSEAQIERVSTGPDEAGIELANGERLQCRLLVAADSRFSETRRALGIQADMHDFGRTMLVCRMRHALPHGRIAWEWFGHGQTRAMLPLQEHHASIVLTVTGEEAQRLAGLPAERFGQEMQDRFEQRLGEMSLDGSRHLYPLVGVYARRFVGCRLALVGDAAVGMHPVTAHGFNFGLASVERLAAAIGTAQRQGKDLADPALLARYQRQHRRGTLPLYLATRAIAGLYTDDRPPAHWLRTLALRAASRVTPFRRALAEKLLDDGQPQRAS